MTREELIARIEAGETGPEIDWLVDEIANAGRGYLALNRKLAGETPAYTTSLDAAVALIGDAYWIVDGFGKASVWGEDVKRGQSRITGNPAAALVTAWLKATA